MAGDSKSLIATLQKARLIDPADLPRLDGLEAPGAIPTALRGHGSAKFLAARVVARP